MLPVIGSKVTNQLEIFEMLDFNNRNSNQQILKRRPLDVKREEHVAYDLFLEENFKLMDHMCRSFGSAQGAKLIKQQFSQKNADLQSRFPGLRWEIIEKGKTPIGIVAYELTQTEMCVADIILYPQFRSRGFGRIIIQELLVLAKSHHVQMRLVVGKTNTRAQRLYKELGFKEAEQSDKQVVMEQ